MSDTETYFTKACLEYWKDLASIIQSTITSIGIIIAGIWALNKYFQKRERAPKVNLTHKIMDCPIAVKKRLLHVEVKIANIGDVIFKVAAGLTCILRICPLSDELEKRISLGKDTVNDDKMEIDWPVLHKKSSKWPEGKFEIEPGEEDSVHYDFIIDADEKIVSVYSAYDHIKKDQNPIAWEVTTIYEIGKGQAK